MGDSLNFGKVNTGSTPMNQPFMAPDGAVEAMAILMIHGSLQKDDNGVGEVTIRKLCELCAPGLQGLLREYICTFGKHGVSVITRCVESEVTNWATRTGESKDKLFDAFTKYVEIAIKEYKPKVQQYLQERNS